MSKKYKTKFAQQWLDPTTHSTWTWLHEVTADSYKAGCKLCKSTFDVGNMGISSIISHEKGKKHATHVEDAQSSRPLFQFATSVKLTTSASSATSDDLSMATTDSQGQEMPQTSNTQKAGSCGLVPGISQYLVKDAVTRAEIRWALSGVMSHSSLRASGNAAELFKLMFPDSDIASKFSMGKDKCAYVVTYGLGPFFKQQLVDVVTSCSFYAISFDESLNKVAQKGQMDIVVRFWSETNQEVATRYLTSTFLGHSTSSDLLQAFTDAIVGNKMDLSKMIHVASDGPNVNLKFARELKEHLRGDPDSAEFFDIGTCSLHIIHGAYKNAHNKCGWKVQDFLRALYYLFKDFPSRRDDYVTASKSEVFPLPFCGIRWVENSDVIQRAYEILPNVSKYIAAVQKKPPASATFQKVSTAIKEDKMLSAKLGFLHSIASQLETYLIKYQSNKPLLPFVYSDLYLLMRSLLTRFIKPDVMSTVKDASKLLSLDVRNTKHHKVIHDIDIGFAASSVCKTASGQDVLQFKHECRSFLECLCTRLLEKCPLKYRLVKGATCLSPQVMLGSSELRQSRITVALEVFVEAKRISAAGADTVKREYMELCEKDFVKNKLKVFSVTKDRLDHALNEIVQSEGSDIALQNFMKQILVIFHGNAAVERSFSFNKEFLVENLHEDSLIAQRHVYDAVLAHGGVDKVDITKAMILQVRSAGTSRNECLKKKQDEKQKKSETLKRINADIKQLEAKKAKISQQAREECEAVNDELKRLKECLKC